MDTLTDVLTLAAVRGSVAASVAGGGDRGLHLGAVPGAAYHAITAGVAHLVLDGRPPLQLLPGDVVLLPGGAPHVLAGQPDAPVRPFDHARAEAALEVGGELAVGEPPATTRILCASYHHDPAATLATFSLLPDVLHITALASSDALRTSLQLLADELRRPGSRAILDHIVNILLIQLLRAWIAGREMRERPPSCLRGLADPITGTALAALHADPARAWTVDALARQVGVSRATLARRFASEVGLAPRDYLTTWRMEVAAQQLRTADDPIGAIARSVGYTLRVRVQPGVHPPPRTAPGPLPDDQPTRFTAVDGSGAARRGAARRGAAPSLRCGVVRRQWCGGLAGSHTRKASANRRTRNQATRRPARPRPAGRSPSGPAPCSRPSAACCPGRPRGPDRATSVHVHLHRHAPTFPAGPAIWWSLPDHIGVAELRSQGRIRCIVQ